MRFRNSAACRGAQLGVEAGRCRGRCRSACRGPRAAPGRAPCGAPRRRGSSARPACALGWSGAAASQPPPAAPDQRIGRPRRGRPAQLQRRPTSATASRFGGVAEPPSSVAPETGRATEPPSGHHASSSASWSEPPLLVAIDGRAGSSTSARSPAWASSEAALRRTAVFAFGILRRHEERHSAFFTHAGISIQHSAFRRRPGTDSAAARSAPHRRSSQPSSAAITCTTTSRADGRAAPWWPGRAAVARRPWP